jgi:superoxide reductase
MQRRDFINLGIVGVSAGFLVPELAVAENVQKMAGGVYFTKQNPGRWSKKVAGHLPNIEVDKSDGVVKLQVVKAHGLEGYNHYIVKHVLLDNNFNFINEKMFNPLKDKAPISNFQLEKYEGNIHVLSMCNKHDVWLNSISV